MDAVSEYFAGPNLAATLLLLLVVLYWLLMIVGVVGIDALDFDFDADVDVGSDLPGADGLEAGGSLLGVVVAFFYLGRIPVMLLMSVFSLIFWLATIYGNRYLNPEMEAFPTLYVLPIAAMVSLVATKLVFWPTLGFFDGMDGKHRERPNRLLGLNGLVTSTEVTEKFGQVTVEQNGPPIVLNVYCGELDRFKKGDLVTLVEYNANKNTYLIAPYAEKK